MNGHCKIASNSPFMTTTDNGMSLWKMPQFSQRMEDARSGKYTSIFSLPFYSSRYGYKMCLRLYILGDGIGKSTHMSLFFVVMKGEFDAILQWPFTQGIVPSHQPASRERCCGRVPTRSNELQDRYEHSQCLPLCRLWCYEYFCS